MRHHELPMQTVYAQTLGELIEADPNVLCLEADLAKASGTIPYVSDKYPDHFIDVGVSEANMISLGAGLAAEGKIPFCSSFTCFATRRVYDQITISVAYPNNNVKIVGTAPGITQGPNGGTHMCFLDLAIMRAMPNMHVYSPARRLRVAGDHAAHGRHEAADLLAGDPLPVPGIFDNDYVFDPNPAKVMRQGEDVTLVTTGYMLPFVLLRCR